MKSEYVVKKGDSLFSIDPQNWHQIYECNRDAIGNDPRLIRPGQQLDLHPCLAAPSQSIEAYASIAGLEIEGEKCERAKNGFRCGDAFVRLQDNNNLIYRPDKSLCHWTISSGLPASEIRTAVLDMAQELVDGMTDDFFRDEGLVDVSKAMADIGLLDEAQKTAYMIEDNIYRDSTLEYSAVAAADALSFNKAQETAYLIENNRRRNSIFKEIAIRMANAGFFDEAEGTIYIIEDNYDHFRGDILKGVAIAKANAGLFDEALDIANNMNELYRNRAEILTAIAVAKGGDEVFFKEAQYVAYMIENRYCRAMALSDIAVAKGGDDRLFEEAVEAASVGWRGDRDPALQYVANAMADTGFFDEAVRTSREIEGDWWRGNSRHHIGVAMAGAGLFDDALKMSHWNSEENVILVDIAMVMADAGLVDEAIKTVGMMKHSFHEEEKLALVMARAGLFDEAIETASWILPGWGRAEVLAAIAVAKGGDVGLFNEAIKEANMLDESSRVDTLSTIAVAMHQSEVTAPCPI